MNINQKRHVFLQCFLKNLQHIADRKYQKRVWVLREGDEVEDLDDAICDFFDDGDLILDEYESYGISKDQRQKLLELRNALDIFIEKNKVFDSMFTSEFLTALPQWDDITKKAQGILKTFLIGN